MSAGQSDEELQLYRAAVSELNSLQSNAAVLDQVLRERDSRCGEKMPEMIRWAARLGISPDDYSSLRVVHVTGTKGKGGTAAYVESILRCHGYRTGFFSSPHLVEARERIRLDGRPLSRRAFADAFRRSRDCLLGNPGPDPMPAYFPFLTLMAVRHFLDQRVDVAVMEVGIGGRYDSTNFVSAPWVCAFSSLGLDHTALLGNSVGLIAGQKAGILKPGCVGVTVDGQPAEGLAVLNSEARLIGCPMLVAQPISVHPEVPDWLAALAPSQLCNASLAAAVSWVWLQRAKLEAGGGSGNDPTECQPSPVSLPPSSDPLPPLFLSGIRTAKWPGRNTILALSDSCTLYMDGAHTAESVAKTADWFSRSTADSTRAKVLLFNRTGDRRPSDLLKPLIGLGFRAALFCPNLVESDPQRHSELWPDLASMSISSEVASARVAENLQSFRDLLGQSRPHRQHRDACSSCECLAVGSVSEAVDWLAGCQQGEPRGYDVLVTGSLHLIGCLLARLRPGLATGEDDSS